MSATDRHTPFTSARPSPSLHPLFPFDEQKFIKCSICICIRLLLYCAKYNVCYIYCTYYVLSFAHSLGSGKPCNSSSCSRNAGSVAAGSSSSNTLHQQVLKRIRVLLVSDDGHSQLCLPYSGPSGGLLVLVLQPGTPAN